MESTSEKITVNPIDGSIVPHECATDLSKVECSICCTPLKTPITLPCNHTFCYLCIKTTLQTTGNYACPLCRSSVPRDTLENASTIISDLEVRTENYAWMYEGRKGGWWFYEAEHNAQIEETYQKYLSALERSPVYNNPYHDLLEEDLSVSDSCDDYEQCTINICLKSYTIDFAEMTQISEEGYSRKIKRESNFVLENGKGVAGLRYINH